MKFIAWFIWVAEQKLDKEIKEREEKYSDLDSKFQRLHKRAKQRIQEVQKVNTVSESFCCTFFCDIILCYKLLTNKGRGLVDNFN